MQKKREKKRQDYWILRDFEGERGGDIWSSLLEKRSRRKKKAIIYLGSHSPEESYVFLTMEKK